MDVEFRKTGIFSISQIWDVSHEIDGKSEQRLREDMIRRTTVQGLIEILKDGRCYEVTMTVSTVSDGTYPPGVQPDGAPSLARPQGTPLSSIYTQYTTNCRLIVVLVNPLDAEIGEYVRLSALHYAGEHDYCHTVFRPEGDREFKHSTVGWKRTS